VVNVFEEAAYWTATRDDAGTRLSGKRAYRLHFPAGQLPPNDAFWSLTVTDTVGYMVSGPTGRSSVDSHSGLVKNADGSVDILLQPHQPSGTARNWIRTPAGRFTLMLRAYLPAAAVVNGEYEVPPVVRARAMNRLVLKYGSQVTIAILAVFVWVIYRRVADGGMDAIIPLAATAAGVLVLGSFVLIYLWPRITVGGFKRIIVRHGLGGGPVPVNTLYAVPGGPIPARFDRQRHGDRRR